MRQKRRIYKKYGMWLLDIICIILATYFAVRLYFIGEKKVLLINTTIYYQLCFIFIAISTIYSFFFDWNRTLLHRGYLIEFRAVFVHTFILLLFAIVVSYFLHFGYYISRMALCSHIRVRNSLKISEVNKSFILFMLTLGKP